MIDPRNPAPARARQDAPHPSRRDFLRAAAMAGAGGIALAGGLPASRAFGKALVRAANSDLRITRIVAQDAPGRRATPVAPNAFAPYRGYRVVEPLIRIQTNQGIEGVTRAINPENRKDLLARLLGVNPFDLFRWTDGRYDGLSEEHAELAESLRGVDLAVFDLLGKAMRRPVADVLGRRARDYVNVYDSSLYMEDLLTTEQRTGLAYLEGRPMPRRDAGLVARKAEWLVNHFYRDEGLRIFKIKTGRARWMDSYGQALERDIEVFRAVRNALGPHFTLFVDVNNGYDRDYTAAKRFIEETSDTMLFGLEEMFQERMVDEHREVMEHADSLGLGVRNIDGETGGIPSEVLRETFETRRGTRPLFEINNPSFSHGLGFVQADRAAKECEPLGVDIAPHNFASRIGFYASVHMGMVTPNWAYAEIDDSHFPGVRATGVEVRGGRATLTGAPGLGIELVPDRLDTPRFVIE